MAQIKSMFSLVSCLLISLCFCPPVSFSCTSMIVSGKVTSTGRPMIWKHRDTGAKGNFIERVESTDSTYGFVGLFNDGDSLLQEAWMGMNDAGFAIMNTASYNVRPYYKNADGEGLVMTEALKNCVTVDDFVSMLEAYQDNGPASIGINANFGVMDAFGGLAYIEADDYSYKRFDVEGDGYLIRTNFSFSGEEGKGKGYVRYDNACHLLIPIAQEGNISPLSFTEKASLSFWNDKDKTDTPKLKGEWIKMDNDYIPRSISTSSIVIEGVNPGEKVEDMRMWTKLGYPPTASLKLATLKDIPDGLRPLAPGFKSPLCCEAMLLRDSIMKKDKRKRLNYINWKRLVDIMEEKSNQSMLEYNKAIGLE